MPVYVSYTQKRRSVKLQTAGNDQLYLCNPENTILLNAEINDHTNKRNHTFEWVQTEGPSVVLTATSEVSAEYTFTDSEDKTFTFYIDRGTSKEQSGEVQVYYTPTSKQSPMVFNHKPANNFSYTVPNRSSLSVLSFNDAEPDFQSDFTGINGVLLSFDDVSSIFGSVIIDRFEVLSSPGYSELPNTVYFTHEGPSYPSSVLVEEGLYRFRVHYKVGSFTKSVTSTAISIAASTIGNYRAVNTQAIFGIVSGVTTAIQRISTIRKILTDQFATSNITVADVQTSRFAAKILNYVTHPETVTIYNTYDACTSNVLYITRVDPSNIGN